MERQRRLRGVFYFLSKLLIKGKRGLLLLSVFVLTEPVFAAKSLSVFVGTSNTYDFLEIVQLKLGSFEPYPVVGFAYQKDFYRGGEYFQLDWGAHLVKHLESASLFEGDLLVLFRWNWFPWNSLIRTSLAMGEGFSLATGFPSSETVSQNIRSVFLNYLWIDLRLSLPSVPGWALSTILHHRSGMYGAIAGVRGGSNYICLGITRILE